MGLFSLYRALFAIYPAVVSVVRRRAGGNRSLYRALFAIYTAVYSVLFAMYSVYIWMRYVGDMKEI